jgi:hypothetical protein
MDILTVPAKRDRVAVVWNIVAVFFLLLNLIQLLNFIFPLFTGHEAFTYDPGSSNGATIYMGIQTFLWLLNPVSLLFFVFYLFNNRLKGKLEILSISAIINQIIFVSNFTDIGNTISIFVFFLLIFLFQKKHQVYRKISIAGLITSGIYMLFVFYGLIVLANTSL